MASIIVIVLLGAIIAAVILYGQARIDKPINTWTDEELIRRLPKVRALASTHFRAMKLKEASEAKEKAKKIEEEIIARHIRREEAAGDRTRAASPAAGSE